MTRKTTLNGFYPTADSSSLTVQCARISTAPNAVEVILTLAGDGHDASVRFALDAHILGALGLDLLNQAAPFIPEMRGHSAELDTLAMVLVESESNR
jgi:hypothetical protein